MDNARPLAAELRSRMPTRRELANVIRVLAMDAVERAQSGHPGAPMGLADVAQVLWSDFLRYNPTNPQWWDRDRFVLSNGHACLLQYAVLHLTGYPLGMEDIKRFRQLGSRTPGHPERDLGIGIETTTGPLGQGLANAVGLALAEKMLAAQFNRPGLPLVDHRTWVIAGDGCLMEGISHEACSLAGKLKLGKLIVLYDSNHISIDGRVEGWFIDDTPRRFEAYGWYVQRDVDGHDAAAVGAALRAACEQSERPALICLRTVIGWGSPTKAGTAKAHSDPLGAEEIAEAKRRFGWTYPPFEVPAELSAAWNHQQAGREAEQRWHELYGRYRAAYPQPAAQFERRMRGELPQDWEQTVRAALDSARSVSGSQATRKSSQGVLNAIGPHLPELMGGSADLTASNSTWREDSRTIVPEDASGNYLHYGVREFGMVTAMSGLALHGGLIPYGGTFLTFSDYMRNGVRLAAMMGLRMVLVYSHDSIALGEDGPTHQPIEHLSSLRLVPNLTLWRPADAYESAVAWCESIGHADGPSCIALTRQGVPQLPRPPERLADVRRGGYVLLDCAAPECLVIATGSEVHMALEAAQRAQAEGLRVRLVSMPCTQRFDAQERGYRDAVLPPTLTRRVTVEAGSTAMWWRYAGSEGRVIGVDRFGASGKAADVLKHYGITADNVLQAIRASAGASG